MTKTIQYSPLDPSGRDIRLLEIEPARSINDPIRCRLVTLRLRDDLEYIGVSSLYGEHSETEHVWVNDYPVVITAHLSKALKHVRAVFYPAISHLHQRRPARQPSGTPGWLKKLFGWLPKDDNSHGTLRVWLDYLCVNQRDDVEKGRQMALMKQAYWSAELVVGWLGERGEHHEITMETLAEIEDSLPATFGDPGDKEKHPENYSPWHKFAEPMTHMWQDGPDGQLPFMQNHWVGFHDFMNRSYFQRRWILEEIATARYPAFLIENTIVPWKQVLRINRLLEEWKHHPSYVYPPVRAMPPLPLLMKTLTDFIGKI